VRAVLEVADECALEPERAARTSVDHKFTKSYDDALGTMKEMSCKRWQETTPKIRYRSIHSDFARSAC
jgi:hypothetical protein